MKKINKKNKNETNKQKDTGHIRQRPRRTSPSYMCIYIIYTFFCSFFFFPPCPAVRLIEIAFSVRREAFFPPGQVRSAGRGGGAGSRERNKNTDSLTFVNLPKDPLLSWAFGGGYIDYVDGCFKGC